MFIVHYTVNGESRSGRWAEGSPVFLNSCKLSFRKGTPVHVVFKILLSIIVPPQETKRRNKRVVGAPFPLLIPDLLAVVISFLPVFPERFACLLVCKLWNSCILHSGLAATFAVGTHGMPGPCYLDMPISFVKFILDKSQDCMVELDLTSYDGVTDAMLAPVLRGSKRLKVLLLNYCTQITNTTVFSVAENNHELQQLEIKGLYAITDDPLCEVADHCKSLTR